MSEPRTAACPIADGSSIDAAEVRRRAQELAPRTVELYRWLHRHPELSFQEHDTARFIIQTLKAIDGVEQVESPTPTSVRAAIRGGSSPEGGGAAEGGLDSCVIALRADIDALAIDEQTGLEHASERPGVMHACGHDGHVAILLSVAQLLAGLRTNFAGEVRLLFEHAEEQPPGGAREFVAVGAMEGVDAVVGLHLNAQMPTGSIAASSGVVLASGDMFTIRVEGAGGHGAYPHETVDPVAIGAQIVTNLQHITSRTVDPMASAVVSVTRFLADSPRNVIPSSVELAGTIRALDADVRTAVLQRLERIATGVAVAHGAAVEVAIQEGYPVLVNDLRVTEVVRAAVAAGYSDCALVEQLPEMAIDDFSVLASEAPGCYFFVGAGDPVWERSFPHHHARFRIDEQSLPIGVAVLSHVALALLNDKADR
jgi:amidohydrolase